MKPIRVVRDIAHPKAPKSGGGKGGMFGGMRSAAQATFKAFGSNIPFFLWFVIILVESVYVLKLAVGVVPRSPVSQVSDAVTVPSLATSVPQEAIVAQSVAASDYLAPTSSPAVSSDTFALSQIKAGLLPAVKNPVFAKTSTATAAKKTATASAQSTSASNPTPITAQSLLAATTISVTERYTGPYKLVFTTDAGTYGKLTWNLNQTTLTPGGSAPNFSLSASCDPPPDMPDVSALDQSPLFQVKTQYTCTVNLTPLSGSDLRTVTKQFSFTTGPGQLIVTPPLSMNTLLADDTNMGGLVFTNNDTQPVTITGLDLDISYTGLNTTDKPLVLRFQDPTTQADLADYHLENLAADPSSAYAHAATDVTIPLSFTIPGASQKMLPIDVLGVERLSVIGVNPTVAIVLRNVTVGQTLNRIVLNAAQISWSCIVPQGAYDPNATSGPFMTGQACTQ